MGTVNTLVVVCPRPPGAEQNSMLIGMNTNLVRRLLVSVIREDGFTPSCTRLANG